LSFYFIMTSQHTTPTPAEQRDWKEAEDHELVTNSEDNEADTTAKFVEHERREVARKVAEAEQRRKVEEAQAEVQKRKEVSSECSVHFSVLMRRRHDRHAELKRLAKRRRQQWPRQRARQRKNGRRRRRESGG